MLDVIIPAKSNLEMTRQCCQDVRVHSQVPVRIILVDSSEAGLLAPLRDIVDHTVEMPFRSLAGLWNAGARAGQNEFVCWLNNDAFVGPDWTQLVIDLQENPKLGVVSAVQPEHYPAEVASLTHYAPRTILRSWWGLGETDGWPTFNGCCFVARRSSFDRIGGFDERFTLFREETDFVTQINLTEEVGVDTRVRVRHLGNTTVQREPKMWDWHNASAQLFEDKWAWLKAELTA